MTTTYQTERLATCWEEISALLPLHYDEIALDQDVVPLDPDWSQYQLMENMGKLHITTCRMDGKVIAYYVARVDTSPHYKTTLHAFVDVYFLKAEHRNAKIGKGLFKAAEAALQARGVKKILSATKIHDSPVTGKSLDVSPLFEYLGWKQIEKVYAKCL